MAAANVRRRGAGNPDLRKTPILQNTTGCGGLGHLPVRPKPLIFEVFRGVDAPLPTPLPSLPRPATFPAPVPAMRSDPTARVGMPVVCAAVVLAATAAGGCRFTLPATVLWGADGMPLAKADESSTAALAKPAPRTIPLELTFVRSDAQDPTFPDELWKLSDEQVLDAPLRRRLAANGLRVGVVTGPLPTEISARLQDAKSGEPDDGLPDAPSERPALVRRALRLLPGRPSELVACSAVSELVLLEHDGDQVHGGTYRDASTHFSLRSVPAADGRTRVELTPVVRHGPTERSWVGEEGVFRMETGQREHPLDRLRFSVMIPTGGLLLVGPDGDEASTAGDAFFRERDLGRSTSRCLAIRPQARMVDPLFADSPPADSISTDAADPGRVR